MAAPPRPPSRRQLQQHFEEVALAALSSLGRRQQRVQRRVKKMDYHQHVPDARNPGSFVNWRPQARKEAAKAGGQARAMALTTSRRREIAEIAAAARWEKARREKEEREATVQTVVRKFKTT